MSNPCNPLRVIPKILPHFSSLLLALVPTVEVGGHPTSVFPVWWCQSKWSKIYQKDPKNNAITLITSSDLQCGSIWFFSRHAVLHSFWHSFQDSIRHCFWHSIWHLFRHTFWHSVAQIIFDIISAFYLASIATFCRHSFWHSGPGVPHSIQSCRYRYGVWRSLYGAERRREWWQQVKEGSRKEGRKEGVGPV